MKYKVLVQHFGDRQYFDGETRTLDNEQDANELINMGLIAPFDENADDEQSEPLEPKQKAKAPPKNKAESEPENKGE